MARTEKSLMRQLIEEQEVKDIAGVQALVKELTVGMIQECMEWACPRLLFNEFPLSL